MESFDHSKSVKLITKLGWFGKHPAPAGISREGPDDSFQATFALRRLRVRDDPQDVGVPGFVLLTSVRLRRE